MTWTFPVLKAIRSLAQKAAQLVYIAAGMFTDLAVSEANQKRLEWCLEQIRPAVEEAMSKALRETMPWLLGWLGAAAGSWAPLVMTIARMVIESAYEAAKRPSLDEMRETGGLDI